MNLSPYYTHFGAERQSSAGKRRFFARFPANYAVDERRKGLIMESEVKNMSKHSEKAVELFRERGWNCAQSVAGAFCDATGMDMDTAKRISAPFGGGMGRLREVCGAMSGALMAMGLLCAPEDPADRAAKAEHYAMVQEFARRFRERNGSLYCRDLLQSADTRPTPSERTEQFYRTRPCERIIRSAAEILDEMLEERKG